MLWHTRYGLVVGNKGFMIMLGHIAETGQVVA